MTIYPLFSAAVALTVSSQAFAGGYASAVPDVTSVQCVFNAVSDPVIAATSVQILRTSDADKSYVWIEDGLPPLPVVGFFRQPDARRALASVSSADLGGVFGMITYDADGKAMLSKHSTAPEGGLAWSAQRGTCSETKGA